MTANQIAYQRNLETNRSNLAQEVETKRHNLRSEDLGIKNLIEQQRHNYATEAEANRSNLAKEMETTRSNRARESLTAAYNTAQISQGWASIRETQRSNLAREEDTDKARAQNESQFKYTKDQEWNTSILDREQRDRANTRSGFVSLLNTGVNAVSGIAQSILRAIR